MAMEGFSDLELKVVELRTQGRKPYQIAATLGITRTTTYNALWRVMSRLGFDDVAELVRWAIENGFDEPLGPESPEERPYPGKPKPRYKRIMLGRVRRAQGGTI